MPRSPCPIPAPRGCARRCATACWARGKRLRPTLVYLTGESLGAPPERLDAPAAAVELIHVYSLVHDDLPAMDDDDLRRGRPTCHRAYDEATAILVGDALQALAFAVLANEPMTGTSAQTRLEMIRVLARATGTGGMAGGQAIDLAAVGQQLTVAAIENMHRRKTGALIEGSVVLGALAAGVTGGAELDALKALRRRDRPRLPDPGRHPRRRGRCGAARQVDRRRRRARQADLPEHRGTCRLAGTGRGAARCRDRGP